MNMVGFHTNTFVDFSKTKSLLSATILESSAHAQDLTVIIFVFVAMTFEYIIVFTFCLSIKEKYTIVLFYIVNLRTMVYYFLILKQIVGPPGLEPGAYSLYYFSIF